MKKNILVVDDSESIREVVSSGLIKAGYHVVVGVNGQHALEMLGKAGPFDLVITDLNMPIMDGISFLREMRNLDAYKYLPVLILTTESQAAKKEEARLAGATGWIIKPFVHEKLITVVKKVIG
jgi:two-component system, chemotaxis family, chemotaxis protein CheY